MPGPQSGAGGRVVGGAAEGGEPTPMRSEGAAGALSAGAGAGAGLLLVSAGAGSGAVTR